MYDPSFPLVSIILATHNGEKYLAEQMKSLIRQSYPSLEIIVVDDASTDATPDIVKLFQQKHDHIKLYKNEKVLGPIKNFEKGLRLSKGEYISLCDQDDVWMAEKVEKTMSVIGHCNMAYCNAEFIDENGNGLGRNLSEIKNLRHYGDCLAFSIGNAVSGNAAIFKRCILATALPMPEKIIHDWWLAFIAVQDTEIKYTSEILLKYRQHSQNYIGAIHVKNRARKKESRNARISEIRFRMNTFYQNCAVENKEEKEVLRRLAESYENFSVRNDYRRMKIFFSYRSRLLAIKKRSVFRQWLFCLKMFFKVI